MKLRSTWRSRVATALLALACGACDAGGSGPTSPSSQSYSVPNFDAPAYPAPGPDTFATPRAALAIRSFAARTSDAKNSVAYFPTVSLQETTGTSAVTIDRLYFVLPSGYFDFESSATCIGARWQVPAGGTWTSEESLRYCMDFIGPVDLAGKELRLTVTYRDERGEVGQVTGYTTVTGAGAGR